MYADIYIMITLELMNLGNTFVTLRLTLQLRGKVRLDYTFRVCSEQPVLVWLLAVGKPLRCELVQGLLSQGQSESHEIVPSG